MRRLLQISDCHIDDIEQSIGVNSHQNLSLVVDKITQLESDALLISGDLSHHGSLNSYKKLKQLLTPINTDLFVIGGNHDNEKNLSSVFGEYLFTLFTLGEWDIISVDSVQAGQTSGYLTKEALLDLDTRLTQSTAKYILLVLHHPIVPMQSTWDDALSLENPQDLFTVLSKHPKIQAVLFGHAHQSAEFIKNGLKIIACPSTAVQFTEEKRIGFNCYRLYDDGRFEYHTEWIIF
ncbi:3',5'-cyclic-nucleotide phosphodiesterase [uncultured Candidatus Thioglobus sp.]|nr:3',5'-cyclic-nucleotide phosphodiesterase [uncultured Candidatus Thioglobus sp.]